MTLSRPLETVVPLIADRAIPPADIAAGVAAIQASGVADGVLFADQLGNFATTSVSTSPIIPST